VTRAPSLAQAVHLLVLLVPTWAWAQAALPPDAAKLPPASRSAVDVLVREGTRHNLDGDYAAALAVWKQLRKLAPEHPAPHVYGVDTLYWLMIHDDSDTRFDEAIKTECAEAIRKAEALVEARPDDPEGHFLLGQALMHLGRVYGIRLEIFKAGRLGEQARVELERVLELDPSLVDARYPLGLYYYYASFVPSLVKWLSFLWFIPTGDGDTGLAYLDQVRTTGDLHRDTAAFFLANIRTYHPARIDRPRAEMLVRELHARHPRNAMFHFELIELLAMREHHEEVIEEARILESYAGLASRSRQVRGRASVARVWRARAEMLLGRADEAWRVLEPLGPDGPETPNWSASWVLVTRGQILDLKGDREGARSWYQRVAAMDLPEDEYRSARMANEGLAAPFFLEEPPTISATPERSSSAR
jgi:tetratricopeptide (TPR) repeat protein